MAVDVNVTVGPWPTDDHEQWSTGDVSAHCDRFGLAAVVVRHSVAVRYDPAEGNRRLAAELAAAADPRLLPGYVLGPLDSGEHGAPADLPERLRADGVRAVWLFPRSHGWSLAGPEARSLLGALRRAGLPVLVELDEVDWSEVDELAAAAPELNVVVCGVGYRSLRQLVSVLDRRPSVHVDLSFLASQDGLELLVGRYGPGRLLWASGAPSRDPAGAAYLWRHSDLDGAARAAVAGGNARRLLGLPAAGAPPSVDPGWPAGPGGDVVDAHGHIGAWPSCWVPRESADDLVAAMDRAGTTQAVISDLLGIWADPVAGNARMLAATAGHPGRLYGYLVASPHRPQDEPLLERQLREPAVRGFKVHPHTHECALDDRRYEWIWALARRHGVPVLGHGFAGTWHSDPYLFGAVAERHPDLVLLVGHSGATVEGFRRTIEVCRRHPNVYAETCGSWLTGRWLGRLVDALGPQRVLHGTDACFIDQRYGLGRVHGAALTDHQRALVLAGNARRLLQLPLPPQRLLPQGGN
ncbi:amidohydrolase family protein [Micromonospora cathayae]|uniref:Amidohydrolase family protein n=1 Tax=Micromonospora cathayae TaxID=3028804 RepID=A0ABY7ZIF9_9ACTN|nr:amidohydrolase family protein [Micromonospora sp. HUAS 3]WDZ82663.1 amidohydrolase family protein [Micromonospora sp. HUAS 3]